MTFQNVSLSLSRTIEMRNLMRLQNKSIVYILIKIKKIKNNNFIVLTKFY